MGDHIFEDLVGTIFIHEQAVRDDFAAIFADGEEGSVKGIRFGGGLHQELSDSKIQLRMMVIDMGNGPENFNLGDHRCEGALTGNHRLDTGVLNWR